IYISFTFLLPRPDNCFGNLLKLTNMKIQLFLAPLLFSFAAPLFAAESSSDSTGAVVDMSVGLGCGQVGPAIPRIERALESFQRIQPLSLDPLTANEKLARDAVSPDSSIAH